MKTQWRVATGYRMAREGSPHREIVANVMQDLKERIHEFVTARGMADYHSPKNLVMALSVEASELVERFQWKTERDSRTDADEGFRDQVAGEVADVAWYLLLLAEHYDIDIVEAIRAKLHENEERFPESVRYRPH